MTTVSRSALVPFSAEEMFRLVDDVDSYQDFLPWVKESRELHRDGDTVRATIVFSRGGFEKAFTTQNRLQHGKIIDIRLVEGPFRHLDGYWRFDPLGEDACKISLDMDFDFNSRILAMAFGRVFTQVCNNLVDSFVRRAEQLYGRKAEE